MNILLGIVLVLWLSACAVLVLVILVQSGKGGGLSGLVGAGTTLGDQLGATGAEKTLNRWTSYCAIGFLVLGILLVLMSNAVYQRGPLDDVPELEVENQSATQQGPEASTSAGGSQAPAPDTSAGVGGSAPSSVPFGEPPEASPAEAGLAPAEKPAAETGPSDQ
ncbi:MAG TPA: preprotein translocase subunit SecG [Sumerlaeia bacterium]|nr:preprotein translocase subunit SecG [Sumerlaeia bacterium]